jgi:hypothetical protein
VLEEDNLSLLATVVVLVVLVAVIIEDVATVTVVADVATDMVKATALVVAPWINELLRSFLDDQSSFLEQHLMENLQLLVVIVMVAEEEEVAVVLFTMFLEVTVEMMKKL